MSDDLDDLKSAMQAATPSPNPEAKAATLSLAEKSFEQFQETRHDVRLTSDEPRPGFWTGARKMLKTLTPRVGLTVTTAIVAVAFVAMTPVREMMLPPNPAIAPVVTEGKHLADSDSEVGISKDEADQFELEVPESVRSRMRFALGLNSRRDQLSTFAKELFAAPSVRTPAIQEPSAAPTLQLEEEDEHFANAQASPLMITAETPVSTFSIDVDTASYAVVRNSLLSGHLPDPEAVRIEEMINYFPYSYPEPETDVPFRSTVSVSQTPWNADTKLVHIGIQGKMPPVQDRPPLNLVFLIDTSGSMEAANKLPLLKQSFSMMLGQLRDNDQIAIVTYAGNAGQVLEPTPASEQETILSALNKLGAGGSTAGESGLRQAYATAAAMAKEGEVTRVLLATDGDFNVGVSDPEDLKRLIETQRDSGTYLSVLGFGRGNLNDATMQALAQNGNGQAAYIDTLAEAQKVLVDQLTGALFPIANDVKIQVEFNPATVAEYRLIGYVTRALRREDFNNDRVDAGDIGAGHSVTALYEVTPVGSPAQLSDPLRYQPSSVGQKSGELGFLRLRYKAPGDSSSNLIEQSITTDLPEQPETGFAAAIAGFGQLLQGGIHLGDWSYDKAIELAIAHKGRDDFGYRTEAIQLMRLAKSLGAK